MQTNNKLREALAALVSEIGGYSTDGLEVVWCGISGETIRKARAAVAEPVKNCEVGTVEGQYSRMFRECYEWMCMDCKQSDKDLRKCALSWAQKPYKEGGAE